MRRWKQRFGVVVITVLVGGFGGSTRSDARDLTDSLIKGYVGLAPFFAGSTFCPCAFAQSLASALGTATSQTISLNVPIASVAPAFTYRFNSSLNVFERSTGILGPMFAERALTIGKGNFNFALGYAYVGFDDINGKSLNHLTTRNGVFVTNQGDAAELRTNLDVQTHVIAPTFRYGITDQLDVSVILPILNTSLRIRNTTVAVANQITPNLGDLSDFTNLTNNIGNLRFVRADPRVVGRPVKSSASATGIGDIVLRSKYNFWYIENSAAAIELDLVLPSGEKDDLQGTGDTHVIPRLIGSHVMSNRVEPHISLGLDLNGNDVDRSSFIFGVGATVQTWQRLVMTVDVLGRSEFSRFKTDTNTLSGDGLRLDRPTAQCTAAQPCRGQSAKVAIFPEKFTQRNDIVNFALGLRYAFGDAGSMYFGGVMPLNHDGFRSEFIPTGGVEYTF